MTEQQLAEIEARANAATPGPWECKASNGPGDSCLRWVEAGADIVTEPSEIQSAEHNAAIEFIAHAREDIPALVAEVRALRELLAQVEASLSEPRPPPELATLIREALR